MGSIEENDRDDGHEHHSVVDHAQLHRVADVHRYEY